jgi:4,5-dihydroxyphthalate decarboxylase
VSKLKLTLACWDYDRTRPLMDGRVQPDGIDLQISVLRPRETFQRMLNKQEFQVSELSLASYTALKSRGECPFVAIPVLRCRSRRGRSRLGKTRPDDTGLTRESIGTIPGALVRVA